MNLLQAAILGAIQGVTEWFPISSSAHLVLIQDLIGSSSVLLDAVVHGGTLLPVLLVFRREIFDVIVGFLRSLLLIGRVDFSELPYECRLPWYVVIGTLPVVMMGFLLADRVESLFLSREVAGLGLLVTGALLLSTKWSKSKSDLDLKRAIIIGVVQAAALVPGISRSGSTISAGLLSGLSKEEALKFSFLLSIPALAGAVAFEVMRAPQTEVMSPVNLAGFLSSCLVGFIAIKTLINFMKKGKLHWFSYYCFILGALAIVL